MPEPTIDWRGNTFHNFGTVFDIVQSVVICFLYLSSLTAVISAIRTRCKNRSLIIILAVTGILIQTIYLLAPYRVGLLNSNKWKNIFAENDSDMPTDSLTAANTDALRLPRHKYEPSDIQLYGNVIVYMTQEGEITNTKYPNMMDKSLLEEKMDNEQYAVTKQAKSWSEIRSDDGFRCADLRLPTLFLYSLIFICLSLACVRQNKAVNLKPMVKFCMLIYVATLTSTLTFLYTLMPSDNTDIFTMRKPLDNLMLSICSQNVRNMFPTFIFETFGLYLPTVGVLLVALYWKTGNTKEKGDRRCHVFQECRTVHGEDCMACSGANNVVGHILLCYVGFLFIVRPIHYTYTYVTHDKFYDVWIIICVMIMCAGVSVNSVFNVVSSKFNNENAVSVDEHTSLSKEQNIT
ncbi:uncharacterized protein LOC132548467 [Ylistrum balloti]|uniref:uncharacterized protein LOC132548467 n=1 Tax=Ylistrum balloti TaxID=509963 RepID=UPI0029059637|nr:uncharacterized protein LOC132548467 [Ylistrum balloti]